MPWDKKTIDGEICVYKKTTGKVLHCYSGDDAEEKANKYLAVLHMHAPASEKEHFKELYGLAIMDGDEVLEYKEVPESLIINIQSDAIKHK